MWYGLGNAYLHKHNYEDACCTFSKAHALNSEDDNCIYNLIVSLAKSGRIDDAELLFQNSKKRYQEDSAEVLRCIIDDCKSKAADFKRLSDNECIELYRKNPEDFWNYVIEEKKRTVNKLLLEDGDFYLRRCNHLKNNLVHLIGTTGENLISIRNALVRDNGDEAYSMCIFDILDTYDSKYIKY